MFLKNLKVYGFKTFGKKVSVDFQKGITAIVGPNGSGKSNLIEALNWVTGETRMADLRVKSASQLIFHGSPSLKPLSLAEVSLTIENSDGHLPIDYSEVNITRRVSKDGQTEYFINKNRCILKDITNLFIGTGVGRGAYSVMRQGAIDRLLRQKPEERREIFEEAAGILKYRNRRRETERDLEKAEVNLKQIRPTMLEVERQFTAKKKQAERAEKYNNLVQRKDQIEVDIHLIKIFEIKKNMTLRVEQREKFVLNKNTLLEKLRGIEQEIDDSIQQSQELQESQHQIQTSILQHEGQVSSIKQRIVMLEEKKHGLQVSVGKWQESLAQNTHKINQIGALIEDFAKEKEQLEKMVCERQDNLEKYARDIEQINKILEEDAVNIKKHQGKIDEIRTKLVDTRGQLEEVINKLVEEIDRRKAELKGSAEVKQDLKNSIARSLDEVLLFLRSKRDILADLSHYDIADKKGAERVSQALAGFNEGLSERIDTMEALKGQFSEMDNLIAGFDEIIFARAGIHAQKEGLDSSIKELEREEKSHYKRIADLETDIENQKHKIETIRQLMHESQISLVQMREKLRSVDEKMETQNTFRADIERQKANVQQSIKEASEEVSRIDGRISEANEEFLQQVSKQDELKQKLTKISQDLSSVTMLSSNKEQKALKLKEELENLHEKIENIIRVITTYEVELRTIYDNFYENYSVDLKEHEGSMQNKKFDMAALRTELKKIKEEVKSLGHINLMAVDECRELEERYKLLKEQIEDIEKSKKNLEAIIKEINKNSEEIFQQTFSKIKVNFYHIFRRLFDGGRAEINLTDPDHVLESGIEIMVQPPSKSLQSVGLLSGGESSMTAIALLFAIFMVKPSPFCLLDEIDAALDGPNIGRFKNLLAEFRDTTQFLMISHNINTLKAVDAIYGVSMGEEGVSSLISLDINDLEKNKKKYIEN